MTILARFAPSYTLVLLTAAIVSIGAASLSRATEATLLLLSLAGAGLGHSWLAPRLRRGEW